jgi:hypothetical protein
MSVAASWPTFLSPLKRRGEVAVGTMAFEFQKPSNWTFLAGQFVDITLQNPAQTDSEGNTRGFSVSSARMKRRSWSPRACATRPLSVSSNRRPWRAKLK